MASRGSDPERVNAFRFEDHYLFRHFFDGEEVFDRLRRHYAPDEYRFEVPASAFEPLSHFLDRHGYDLSIVDDPDRYVVVVRKYRAHPGNVFKASVFQWSTPEYNCFLLRDEASVETAVRQGAVRLTDTPISVTYE